MSASSTDSWILISLTVLVVLLLFYLSKKMICSITPSTSEENYRQGDPASSEETGTSSNEGSAVECDSSHSSSSSLSFRDYLSREEEVEQGRNNRSVVETRERNDIPLTATTRPPISIIGMEGEQEREECLTRPPRPNSIAFSRERKDLLEGQLRTQVGRIAKAEKEIQRLVQLLAISEGLDSQAYILSSATRSTSPFYCNLPRHLLFPQSPSPSTVSNYFAIPPIPPSSSNEQQRSTLGMESNEPSQNVFPSQHQTQPSPESGENLPNDLEVTPILSHPLPASFQSSQSSSSVGLSSSGNHSQSSSSPSSSISSSVPATPDSLPILSSFLHGSTSSNVAVGSDSAASYQHHLPLLPQHHFLFSAAATACRCNLCLSFTSTANYRNNTSSGSTNRRMLMLHRMLLPYISRASPTIPSHLYQLQRNHFQQQQQHPGTATNSPNDEDAPVRDRQSQYYQNAQLTTTNSQLSHSHLQALQDQLSLPPSYDDNDCASQPPPPSYEECVRNNNFTKASFHNEPSRNLPTCSNNSVRNNIPTPTQTNNEDTSTASQEFITIDL